MRFSHPLSRKLFVTLMGIHLVGGFLYLIPGFASEFAPVSLSAGFGAVYVLLSTLTLYGFTKKFSWVWVSILAVYLMGIIETFVFKDYQTNPNIPFDIYIETFSTAVILALYGRAVRMQEQIIPKRVGLLKRDTWHWAMVLLLPVFGEFISLYILGRDTVYTRTKGNDKLYVPSSRAVLAAIAVLIGLKFAFLSIRLA